jgi:murein DD-endopeptidase MepM/ murein hydrolase activator NlpD
LFLNTSRTGPPLGEILRITTSEDLNEPVTVCIQIPHHFVASLPAQFSVELFAKYKQLEGNGEDIDSYQRLRAIYDVATGTACAVLPAYAFTPSNSMTATIIIGSYDNAPFAEVRADRVLPPMSPFGDMIVSEENKINLFADLTFSIPPQIGSPVEGDLVVTSDFGLRFHPILRRTRLHAGIDIATNGDPVFPVLPGVVVMSGPNGGYGQSVTIDHGNDLWSSYSHLEPSGLPPVGTAVIQTTQIGISDSTGLSTGPHLHFELLLNGSPIDPELFINQQDAATYLSALSVVGLIDGLPVEATRRTVTSASFRYQASLDLKPLNLSAGFTYNLSIALQGPVNTVVLSTTLITIESVYRLESESVLSVAATIDGLFINSEGEARSFGCVLDVAYPMASGHFQRRISPMPSTTDTSRTIIDATVDMTETPRVLSSFGLPTCGHIVEPPIPMTAVMFGDVLEIFQPIATVAVSMGLSTHQWYSFGALGGGAQELSALVTNETVTIPVDYSFTFSCAGANLIECTVRGKASGEFRFRKMTP